MHARLTGSALKLWCNCHARFVHSAATSRSSSHTQTRLWHHIFNRTCARCVSGHICSKAARTTCAGIVLQQTQSRIVAVPVLVAASKRAKWDQWLRRADWLHDHTAASNRANEVGGPS